MINESNMAASIAATAPTLSPMQDLPVIQPAQPLGSSAAEGTQDTFIHSLQDALHEVDGAQHEAQDKMAAVDSGQSDDLVGAMLSSQEASMSFSMLMQARNKIASAVDDLLKLQL